MAASHKVPVTLSIPYKVLQSVHKLCVDYGYSQSKMLEAMISLAATQMYEDVETTPAFDAGHKRRINNQLRKLL